MGLGDAGGQHDPFGMEQEFTLTEPESALGRVNGSGRCLPGQNSSLLSVLFCSVSTRYMGMGNEKTGGKKKSNARSW